MLGLDNFNVPNENCWKFVFHHTLPESLTGNSGMNLPWGCLEGAYETGSINYEHVKNNEVAFCWLKWDQHDLKLKSVSLNEMIVGNYTRVVIILRSNKYGNTKHWLNCRVLVKQGDDIVENITCIASEVEAVDYLLQINDMTNRSSYNLGILVAISQNTLFFGLINIISNQLVNI